MGVGFWGKFDILERIKAMWKKKGDIYELWADHQCKFFEFNDWFSFSSVDGPDASGPDSKVEREL